MKIVRRFILILLLAVFCAVGSFFAYHRIVYPIGGEDEAIAQAISQFYYQRTVYVLLPDVVLHDRIELGGREYILSEIGDQMGCAALEENFMGRKRIVDLSFGGGDFTTTIVHADEKTYLLFGGRDEHAQITDIAFRMGGEDYQITLEEPGDPFFFHKETLDADPGNAELDRSTLTFADRHGNDITPLYKRSGGGIQ